MTDCELCEKSIVYCHSGFSHTFLYMKFCFLCYFYAACGLGSIVE